MSPRLCLAIDAGTFAVSVLTLLVLRTAPAAPSDDAASSVTVKFLARSTLMRMVLLLTLVSNLAYFGMLEVALPVHSSAVSGYGASLAAFGLGSLLGGLAITVLERQSRRGLVACGIGVAQGLFFATVAFFPGLGATVVLMALAGLTCGVLNVFYLSRVQEHVPGHLLGRAMSLLMLAVFAIHPISVAAAGVLAKASGPGLVFLAAGTSIAVAFLIGSATKTYRDL